MNIVPEKDVLVNVNIQTKRRDTEEIKSILGDVGSMPTCSIECQCFLCDLMETKFTSLKLLYPILKEICTCFYLKNNMAAVTLTNHLLESAIKFALVYKEGNGKTFDDPRTMDTLFEEECKMYMGEDLGNNIKTLYNKGMITVPQKDRLIHLKNLYRNPYSHASNNALVNMASQKIVYADLSNPSYIEERQAKVAFNPLFLVNARIDFINRTGFSYFQEVVNLMAILDAQIHQLYVTNKKSNKI